MFRLSFYFILFFFHLAILAKIMPSASETVLFNNLPKVALLVKEQYVEPQRIDPDSMLASILEALELRISKLVITLPKSLEGKSKLGEDRIIKQEPAQAVKEVLENKEAIKEHIVLEMGTVKKSFEFEPKKSLWGMIFLLRDIFKWVEVEGNKQGLTKGSIVDDPIEWEKLEYVAINAMLTSLDPHSIFLEPKYARDLTLTTKGEFGGCGFVLGQKEGILTVMNVMDDTPAFKAGVKAKDKIVKINDMSSINMDLNEAVSYLRGEPGTIVNITVQRGTSNLEFALKRAIIKVESVAFVLLDGKVGYIRVKAFQGKTALDVKQAFLEMKKKSKNKLESLVLDLRGNPGGLLREAVDISDLFLDGGEIVSTQGAQKETRQVENASKGQLDPNLKIAVLLDSGSASASEIVSGALKYRDRAIIIGERSFGKGSVQMLFDFPQKSKSESDIVVEPAALKLTIAQYYAPGGKTIQTVGVGPDIELHEINVNKKEELSLFGMSLGEKDLTAHLTGIEKPKDESFISINYMALPQEEKDNDFGKIDINKLNKDFSVTLASELLRKSKNSSRQEILNNISSVGEKFKKQQEEAIYQALKKYNIDWSKGEYKTKPLDYTLTVTKNNPTLAGDKLYLGIKIKNNTDKDLYQIHAISHSKTGLFDHKEFLFGKIESKKEVEREVFFEIPKDVISRKDLITLEVRDQTLEKISEHDISLDVVGLKRPTFSHIAFIDDTALGNQDGKLQEGEKVDLVVWVKNIGEGKAFEPTVVLKSEMGNKIQIEKGRAQSGELLPGKEVAMRLTFLVKEKMKDAKFELQIFDGQMHDAWQDKFLLNLEDIQTGKTINQGFLLKTRLDLLEKNVQGAKKIASLKEGSKVLGIKEFPNHYLVKASDNLLGFLEKSTLSQIAIEKGKMPVSQFDIFYNRIPPKVQLSFGDGTGLSKESFGNVSAKLFDAEKIKELMLYVNGKKVLFKGLSGPQKEQSFNHKVSLKPGVNVITLFARENAFFGQKGNITVFYDDKNKLVLPKTQKAAQNDVKKEIYEKRN